MQSGRWPELLPTLNNLIRSGADPLRATALCVLTEILPLIAADIDKNPTSLSELLDMSLTSSSGDVRAEAVGALAAVIQSENRQTWRAFTPLLAKFIEILPSVISSDIPSAQKMLMMLVDAAELHSAFFKPVIGPLLDVLIKILREENLSDLHGVAMEIVVGLVTDKPQMCAAVTGFLPQLIDTTLLLLTGVKSDEDWQNDMDEDEDDGMFEGHDVGEFAIDKVVMALQDHDIIQVVYEKAFAYFNMPEWYHQFAALMALSQTAEYIPEDKADEYLTYITQLCLMGLKNQHPRVRFAACQCIGQTALDHAPAFQTNHSEDILRALLEALNDPVARVQSHSAAAFVNFAEESVFADLEPFLDGFMVGFFTRFDLNWRPPREGDDDDETHAEKARKVREQAVTGMAVLAGTLEGKFAKYYNQVVPTMVNLIQQTGKDERKTRGKAIECLSIIGVSVGKEVFADDGVKVMEVLMRIHHEQLAAGEADDPVKEYLVEGLKRMVRALEEKFMPFMNTLLPPYFEVLKTQPAPINGDLNLDQLQDMTLVTITDTKYCGLKTSVLEEMENALGLIQACVESLGVHYEPLIHQTYHVLLPLLKFKLNDDLVTEVLSVISEILVLCAKLTPTMPQYRQASSEILSTVVGSCITMVKEESQTTEGFEDLSFMASLIVGLARCIKSAGPGLLGPDAIKFLCSEVITFLRDSNNRRANVLARREDPDLDEEDKMKIMDESDMEQSFRSHLLEVLGSIMRFHPQEYLEAAGQQTNDFLVQYLDPKRPVEDQTLGFYVVDDLLENLGEKSAPMWPIFVNRMLESASSSDPYLR